jgi:hypothetical protein
LFFDRRDAAVDRSGAHAIFGQQPEIPGERPLFTFDRSASLEVLVVSSWGLAIIAKISQLQLLCSCGVLFEWQHKENFDESLL